MEQTTTEYADWWAWATTVASDPTLTTASRLLFAVMALEAARDADEALTEAQWAARAGMTRHQARQAIAELRRVELVERGWRHPENDRPFPIYRPVIGWSEQDGGE